MQRGLFFILASAFLALLVISNNKAWMEMLSEYRFSIEWLAPDKYKHGDLYGTCYIQRYKEPIVKDVFKTYAPGKRNIGLYIMHDSYLQRRLSSSNFKNLDTLVQVDYRNDGNRTVLDPKKTNILIIESAERYARWRFKDASYFVSQLGIGNAAPHRLPGTRAPLANAVADTNTAWRTFKAKAFNPNINSNLEFNLFDYSLVSPIRGMKALTNNMLFGKLSEVVAISTNREYLLLKETVDTTANTGIYSKLPPEETDTMVAHMVRIRCSFMSKGFKEVYFSIIPNTATVEDSGYLKNHPYNGLIYTLKRKIIAANIPYLDVYADFVKMPHRLYKHGDSHWNNTGKQLWIEKVNGIIEYIDN